MSNIDRSRFRLYGHRPQVAWFFLVVAAVVFVPACSSPGPSPADAADLILHNGKIVTADTAFSLTESVAVKGGRIVATGASADLLAARRGPDTEVIDLEHRTVLPGLIDSHMHPLGAALSEIEGDFAILHSFAEIQDYIREQAAKTPKGQWINVPKTFPARLKELRMPDRKVLDATLDHPVYYDASYACAVNSYALRISGITKDTPDPKQEGARILRDDKGEPTGILTGRASALLKRERARARELTEAESLDALEAMLKRYAATGLTSITDRGAREAVPLYEKLKEQRRLPVRVVLTTRPSLEELQQANYSTGQGDEWVKYGAFKGGGDGGINAGTSFMREPWGAYAKELFGIPDPKNRGDLRMPVEEYYSIMRAAYEKGWPLCSHVQGGAAIDTLLDIFERLDKEVRPIAPSRSHLVHSSFLAADSIARARRLGVLVDVQPAWYYFDALGMSKVVSPETLRYFNPYQSLVQAGVIFAGGSDHMVGWDRNDAVNAYNPFLGMYAAVTRKTAQGEVFYPEERLTREQALRMYTIWGAHLNHNEKDRGSIEAGKLADFVVINRDYLTCPEDEILDIQAVMTIMGGRVTYSGSKGSTN